MHIYVVFRRWRWDCYHLHYSDCSEVVMPKRKVTTWRKQWGKRQKRREGRKGPDKRRVSTADLCGSDVFLSLFILHSFQTISSSLSPPTSNCPSLLLPSICRLCRHAVTSANFHMLLCAFLTQFQSCVRIVPKSWTSEINVDIIVVLNDFSKSKLFFFQ